MSSLYYVEATGVKRPRARKIQVSRFIVLATSEGDAIKSAKAERAGALGEIESWTAEPWPGKTAALQEIWK